MADVSSLLRHEAFCGCPSLAVALRASLRCRCCVLPRGAASVPLFRPGRRRVPLLCSFLSGPGSPAKSLIALTMPPPQFSIGLAICVLTICGCERCGQVLMAPLRHPMLISTVPRIVAARPILENWEVRLGWPSGREPMSAIGTRVWHRCEFALIANWQNNLVPALATAAGPL